MDRIPRRITLAALALAMVAAVPAAPPPDGAPAGAGPSEKSMLLPLGKEDRDAIAAVRDHLLPAPTADLVWVGGSALTREALLGKVTVIQTVGGRGKAREARETLAKLRKALPPEVLLVGLHVPDGADKAKAALEKDPPCPIAIDPSGRWCDALGAWLTPVNLVVNKACTVTDVGLNDAGFKQKVPVLLEQAAEEAMHGGEVPPPPGATESPAAPPAEWPVFTADVGSATDLRGKQVPAFEVKSWFTPKPDPGERLVAVDFWATWWGPCRAAIPHVNGLADKYAPDVLFVGLSDEKDANFKGGLKKAKLSAGDFRYSLALDPAARLKKAFGVKAIPHMAIWSPDGVVRWQGHPASLTEDDLRRMIDANRAANPRPPEATPGVRGWAAWRAAQKSR